MAVRSTQEKPPQTHSITTIIVIQADVVMGVLRPTGGLGGCFCSSIGGAAAPRWRVRRNGPRKVARGEWGCKRRKLVLQPNQDPRQQRGKVVRSGRVHHGRDRRLQPEILHLDPELDR